MGSGAAYLPSPAGRREARERERRNGWRGDAWRGNTWWRDRRHRYRCEGCGVWRRNPDRRRRGYAGGNYRWHRLCYPRIRWSIRTPTWRTPTWRMGRLFGSPVVRVTMSPLFGVWGSPVVRVRGSPVVGVRGSPIVRVWGSPIIRVWASPVIGVAAPVLLIDEPVFGMPAGRRRSSRPPSSRRWSPATRRWRAPTSWRWRAPSSWRPRPPFIRRRRPPARRSRVKWRTVFARRSNGGSSPRRTPSSSHAHPGLHTQTRRHRAELAWRANRLHAVSG